MASVIDQLATVFVTSGVEQLLSALTRAENGLNRVEIAQLRLQKAAQAGRDTQILELRLQNALRAEALEVFDAATTAAQPFLNVLSRIVSETQKAIDSYAAFGREVMNLKALTGASTDDAAATVNMFKAAGVGDSQAMRAILKLNENAFSPGGASAMAMLGISPQAGESTIHLFMRVREALDKIPDGMMKTNLEMRIFQVRSAEALQPILRMSDHFLQMNAHFSEGMSGNLQAIQSFQEEWSLTGEGIKNQVVFPLVRELLPAITQVLKAVDGLIQKWEDFNKLTHGFGNILALGILFGSAMVAAAGAVAAMVSAFKALNEVLRITDIMLAIMDALDGNWVALAIAGALAVAAGITIGYLSGGGQGQQEEHTDQFGDHVNNFGQAVQQFGMNLSDFQRMFGPSGLQSPDIAALQRQGALGAIG